MDIKCGRCGCRDFEPYRFQNVCRNCFHAHYPKVYCETGSFVGESALRGGYGLRSKDSYEQEEVVEESKSWIYERTTKTDSYQEEENIKKKKNKEREKKRDRFTK